MRIFKKLLYFLMLDGKIFIAGGKGALFQAAYFLLALLFVLSSVGCYLEDAAEICFGDRSRQ